MRSICASLLAAAWVAWAGTAEAGRPVAALSGPSAACVDAIRGAEQAAAVPPSLLLSIGVVESGRIDPAVGRVAPWPWTINVEGAGYFFATRDEAIAAVEAARAAGRRSIDVGCMQVNLLHHPTAFADLQDAFDPRTNATYAASFLTALRAQTRDWGDAAAAYHSLTPGVSDDYRRRVVAGWDGAGRYGVVQRAGLTPVSFGSPGLQPRREPAGGYTPEFRARLAQDAAADRAVRVAMGFLPAPERGFASRGQSNRPDTRSRVMLQASLRD